MFFSYSRCDTARGYTGNPREIDGSCTPGGMFLWSGVLVHHPCELKLPNAPWVEYIVHSLILVIHSLTGTCSGGWPNKGRGAYGTHCSIYLWGQWAWAVQCPLDSSQSPASSVSSQHELSLHPDYQRSGADGLRTVHMYCHQHTWKYQRIRNSAGDR